MRYTSVLFFLSWLLLSGCATNDTYNSDDQQNPPGMSGKGMGSGGRGGGGGGHQQGPPDMDKDEQESDPPLPDEAFTACNDKTAGDTVVLFLPDGKELKATCTIVDDHMVAVPEKSRKPARR